MMFDQIINNECQNAFINETQDENIKIRQIYEDLKINKNVEKFIYKNMTTKDRFMLITAMQMAVLNNVNILPKDGTILRNLNGVVIDISTHGNIDIDKFTKKSRDMAKTKEDMYKVSGLVETNVEEFFINMHVLTRVVRDRKANEKDLQDILNTIKNPLRNYAKTYVQQIDAKRKTAYQTLIYNKLKSSWFAVFDSPSEYNDFIKEAQYNYDKHIATLRNEDEIDALNSIIKMKIPKENLKEVGVLSLTKYKNILKADNEEIRKIQLDIAR